MLKHAQDEIRRRNKRKQDAKLAKLQLEGKLCVPLSRPWSGIDNDTTFYMYDDSNFSGITKWYKNADGVVSNLSCVEEVYNE